MPVLVIALDGATFDVLNPWLADGSLPTLTRLMAAGTSGELASTLPPLSAPAWASFMTGKHPGSHGVFDFFRPDAPDLDRHEMVNSTDIRAAMLWEILSAAGLRVGVLNVPVTHPPRPVNGYLVPGLLSPDQGHTCVPPDLLASYRQELGCYRLTPDRLYDPKDPEAFLADLRDLCDTQIRYALRLLADRPVDFAMVHFLATDIAQHSLWHYHDPSHPRYSARAAERYGSALRRIFEQLDRAIGDLIGAMPAGTTTLVISDHGFGPSHQVVSLNRFFIQTGLLRLKRGWRVRARQSLFERPSVWRLAGRGLRAPSFADVDWTRTVAYSLGHIGQVYLNLKGRQPFGIVDRRDYESVRADVIARLRELRDPVSGRPLIDECIVRDGAGGPHADRGPDLHLVMDGYRATAYPLFLPSGGLVTEPRLGYSGDHRPDGVLIAAGPAIRAGSRIAGARLIDLAPTVLHLLGVPIPDDMDGRPLNDLVTESFRGQHPLSYQPAAAHAGHVRGESDDEILVKRLRDLGYM